MTQPLAAANAKNLMMIASPIWYQVLQPEPDPSIYGLRYLAINDPYWRVN
jgi:hypothetical protein